PQPPRHYHHLPPHPSLLFSLILRPPPRPPLFPYTTLFRSTDSRLVTALDHPVFREYRTALERRVGAEAAARILGVSRWNSIVYPSCSFMSQFRQLRIVQPLAVDRTLVSAYSLRLGGAPEQMFRDTVAFANVVNGTGSPVLTDDLE